MDPWIWQTWQYLEEPLHCWPSWWRYISAAFEGTLTVELMPYTQCAWLSPCRIPDSFTVKLWRYGPMYLTNVTKLQEKLHCWPIWWRYIPAAFEGTLNVSLLSHTQCAWLAPFWLADMFTVALWSYGHMNLTEVTIQLESPLHCWNGPGNKQLDSASYISVFVLLLFT